MANNVKIDTKKVTQTYNDDWTKKDFNSAQLRAEANIPYSQSGSYIGGANFDAQLDEMLFNRMIKLKDLRVKPQGNDPGKIYWDGANNKFKVWVNKTVGWADVGYTTTSTSTTSSSTSTT